MRRARFGHVAAALLSLLTIAAPAKAGGISHFYCYAADKTTGTVYVSQTLPVGPISERGRYGEEFAKYLYEEGKSDAKLSGHCVMRAGGEISESRRMLSQGSCPACGGANKFQDVSWNRGGPASPVAENTPRPQKPLPPPPKPVAQSKEPLVVVLGNRITGEVIVSETDKDVKKRTWERARAQRKDGWQELLVSSQKGYGMSLCRKTHSGFVFYVSQGQPGQRDAFMAAREKALADGKRNSGKMSDCKPQLWHAGPVTFDERKSSVTHKIISGGRSVLVQLSGCERKDRNGKPIPIKLLGLKVGHEKIWCPGRVIIATFGVRG